MFESGGPTLRELLHQAMVSVEDGYDLLAPKFDKTPFRTPDAIVAAMAARIGAPGSVESGLDVCCGTGAAAFHLRALCRDRVVGADTSEGMLREARRRVTEAPGTASVTFEKKDALALDYDAEFDVVVSAGAFGHILETDEDRFARGVARALRPGGRFVFVTSIRPPWSSPWRWVAHGFNGAMRVRNALWRPPFVMYYLTFLWPEVEPLLARHGLEAEAFPAPAPYGMARIVVATKRR